MSNTIEILGDKNAVASIVHRTISGDFVDDEITQIGKRAFYYCTSLSTVSFPMVTMVSNFAFQQCTGLLAAYFSNVTTIGSQAFYNCTSLSFVDIPKVTDIGHTAFGNCSSITYVYLGKINHIGAYAFNNCSKLSVAVVGVDTSSVCTLDMSNAFYNTRSNLVIYVPSSLYSLYVSAPQWNLISTKIASYTG